jgi:predicted nucleic acid-binding protein
VTPVFLLDASVLIPLLSAEHVQHDRAAAWAGGLAQFALCPVVEGAFVRFAVRLGAHAREAQEALRSVHARSGFEFWPDSVSYADVDVDEVRGHAEVTDAYLAGLASARGGVLATLDQDLAAAWPESTLLLPDQSSY